MGMVARTAAPARRHAFSECRFDCISFSPDSPLAVTIAALSSRLAKLDSALLHWRDEMMMIA